MEKYFVQINFDDTGKFGDKFINEFKSDDESKKIIFINTKVPIEKFENNEELSSIEKLILMMQVGDKDIIRKIAGDDEMLKKAADTICDCLDDDFLLQEITKMVKSSYKENVSEG